jgi:hypothetical protein
MSDPRTIGRPAEQPSKAETVVGCAYPSLFSRPKIWFESPQESVLPVRRDWNY